MEINSMGQFIAALRKSKGMTQQEVADRLNVSNKAVSRWERDESAPDLTLIPALAELLNVSCDELLRGKKSGTVEAELGAKKPERQLKNLINRTLRWMRTMTGISMALSAVGLILMLGFSFMTDAGRADIGFGAMMIMVIIAIALGVIGTGRTREIRQDSELLAEAEGSVLKKFDYTMACYSYHAYYWCFAVVVVSLPLMLHFDFGYQTMFLYPFQYLQILLAPVLWILLLAYFEGKNIYFYKLIGHQGIQPLSAKAKKINGIMLAALVLAGLLFFIAPYFYQISKRISWGDIWILIGFAILLGMLVWFLAFMIREKGERSGFWLHGLRNLLLLPSVFSWIYAGNQYVFSEIFYSEQVGPALNWALMVFSIFSMIRSISKPKN